MQTYSTFSKEWKLLNNLGYTFYKKESAFLSQHPARLFVDGLPVFFEKGEFRYHMPVRPIMITRYEALTLSTFSRIRCTDRDSTLSASVILGDNIFGDFFYCKMLVNVPVGQVSEVQQKGRYIYLPSNTNDSYIIIPDGSGTFQCKVFLADKITKLLTAK